MMKKEFNTPVMEVRSFDFENIVTDSGTAPKTAAEKAEDALGTVGVKVKLVL